ncbi:hypothetical protein ACT29H_13565 [Thermophagus sp. OGC60D27]|uniref:hypothetical protein n=1 Tax=Thermophagus sp. OGC60D27 TaxID=3458415 RepID=UPI0040380E32
MRIKYLLFIGLGLVLFSLGLRVFGVEWYYFILIPGITLKVIYLVIGLLNGTLAAGRYLALLFVGIGMVGAGGYLKNVLPDEGPGFWMMMTGFLLKGISIVLMVVVGRRRRLQTERVMES